MRVAPRIELTESERRELERLARSNTVSVRLARRARIVLLAAEGKENPASTVMGTFNSINPRKPSMLCWPTPDFRENMWANDMNICC